MRVYKQLPAGFNQRIEGFSLEFMAIFLSILFVIFTPASSFIRGLMVGGTYYFFTSLGTWFFPGQSFGKRWARTQVVTLSGKKPSWWTIHLRDLTKWGLGFFTVGIYFVVAFIIFSYHPQKRTLHDFIFKTQVVFVDDLITS